MAKPPRTIDVVTGWPGLIQSVDHLYMVNQPHSRSLILSHGLGAVTLSYLGMGDF